MHWILQENLINPQTRQHVERLLQARGTGYTLARLVPIFNVLDPDLDLPKQPMFVYGSTGLGIVAKAKGWTPGYYDENLDYRLMLERYGAHCLNAQHVCAELGELTHHWDQFFVRPVLDNKSFAGTVMTWTELQSFRRGVAKVADAPDVTLRTTDLVTMSPITPIDAEYRMFVIDGQVVTGSRYKLGSHVGSSSSVPQGVLEFAQARADDWVPNRACALDIAHTPYGLKVIELNSANSAGFYACDVGRIIDAVNRL